MTKSDLARQYRREYGQKMPTLKLARIMYAENNLLFSDLENARLHLRSIEGKGHKNVKVEEEFKTDKRANNPYKLPETDYEELTPYVIKGHKRGFLINDVHLPYHDINAITCAFDFAKKEKPDFVILNGDIIDCYKLSKWVKDPRQRDFAYELAQFKEFFQVLKKTFNAKIYFKFGNHEERYDAFLFQKAHELVGVEEFELATIIKARAEGIEVIKDKRIIKLNDLNVIHGHELGRSVFNPVNVARGLHLRAKVSALQGDAHKTSEHTETDLEGKIKTTWSVGSLCGLKPPYFPHNSWNHGMAIIDLDSNKREFDVRNYRVYKGKIL